MIRIILLIRKSEQHPQPDGVTVCVTGNAALSPFSWMHYIVMNREDYETHDSAILAHERGHIRLHHSWDLILVDTLTALQWFNPAMWMLRADLRAIHEYEADAAVLSQGINARQYRSGSLSRYQRASIPIPVDYQGRRHRRVLPCQRYLPQYPQKPNQYDVT